MAALRILCAAYLIAQASCLTLAKEKLAGADANPFCMDGHVAPSVFLMGYQKAGSTSLWADLKDNFNLAPATPLQGEDGFRDKEVSYFSNDNRFAKGRNFYLRHFPTCAAHKDGKVMDASPNTIFGGEKTAKRVKEFYGDKAKDLKFIIISRNPTSRMESAYWHFNANVHGNLDKYVSDTIGKAKLWAKGEGEAPEPNLYWPNMYIQHLKPWLEEFSPDQFAFMTMEQYTKHHGAAMSHVSRRLMLTGNFQTGKVYDNNRRGYPQMSQATRKTLDDFYAPYQREFETLVKESKMGFGTWSQN